MNMKSKLLIGVVGLSSAISPALAQQAPTVTTPPGNEPQPVAAEVADEGLGTIVVTARQREESLQSVPLAVSAISGALLDTGQIQNIDSVERYMPNVELGRHPFTGGGLSASIRGVSFGDLDRAFEPTVAVAVDGIFLASNTGAMSDSFDIAQIEVLRGPQGTLFGRNTIGGVINIKRTRPTLDWGAKFEASIGSYDNRQLKGLVNVPIIKDQLGLKAGAYLERSDSFTRRVSDGKREDGIDRLSAFLALRLKTGPLDATLTYDRITDKSNYPSLVPFSAGPSQGTSNQLFCSVFRGCYDTQYQQIIASGFKDALSDYPFRAELRSDAVTLNAKLNLNTITLESITGYTSQKDLLNAENTGAANFVPNIPLFVSVRDQQAKQFSQEVRAVSDFGGALNFVAGLYYMHWDFDLLRQTATVNGAVSQDFSAGQDADAYAAYAEAYLNVGPKLRFTAGGRYTRETKRFYIILRNGATGAVTARCPDPSLAATAAFASCRDPKVTFEKFTPRLIVDYRFTENLMLYGSWSRGYRSGGWNSRATVVTAIGPFEPEEVDSYEAGVRTSFLDNRINFNLTGFYAKYNNKQEEVITSSPVNPAVTQTLVENAGKATIKGIEAEAEFAATDWLRLRGAVGYLDGKYDSFIQRGVDIRSQRNLRYAPEWSVSAGGEVTLPVGRNRFLATANYKYTDRFATSVTKDLLGLNRDFIDAYSTVDATIGYEFRPVGRARYRVSAYVNNAFHDNGRLYRKVITGPFSFGSREVGRTYGLELSFRY